MKSQRFFFQILGMYLWPSQNISYPNRLKFKHQCSLNFISELMQFTRVKQAGRCATIHNIRVWLSHTIINLLSEANATPHTYNMHNSCRKDILVVPVSHTYVHVSPLFLLNTYFLKPNRQKTTPHALASQYGRSQFK